MIESGSGFFSKVESGWVSSFGKKIPIQFQGEHKRSNPDTNPDCFCRIGSASGFFSRVWSGWITSPRSVIKEPWIPRNPRKKTRMQSQGEFKKLNPTTDKSSSWMWIRDFFEDGTWVEIQPDMEPDWDAAVTGTGLRCNRIRNRTRNPAL